MIEFRVLGEDYNTERHHSALGYIAPEEFAARLPSRGDTTLLVWGKRAKALSPFPAPQSPLPETADRRGKMIQFL